MEFIKLSCPNCNGKIEYKEGKTFKCPYCETELMLKENNVYYVDQTINNYYGPPPVSKRTKPNTNKMIIYLVMFVLACSIIGYYLIPGNSSGDGRSDPKIPVRTMPESEVLLYFLKDIFNKGEALPAQEEIASIRYLSARHDDQWHFAYSLDDPFTNAQAEIIDYVIMDKILNTKRIEQKDFEAFSGLTVLKLMNEYEISRDEKVSFRHMQDLKSYTGIFNESFGVFAHYFGDKSKIVDLSTQIRSNQELELLLQFPNLQSLEITYVTDEVTDFHLLNQLPLKSLSITRINDLKWLSSLTGLESLEIDNSEATDYSALYSLSHLQDLKLMSARNLKTLDFIQNMPNLQSFRIDQAGITNLETLRGKTSLTKLHLSHLSQLESVEVVNSLTSLTELSIKGYYGSVPEISLPNLRNADLNGEFIPQLQAPALKSLTVKISGSANHLDGAELVKYPQLEQLTAMEDGDFTGINSLDRLPSLHTLNLNETAFFDGMSELFNLQHIKTINCTKCSFQINNETPFANNTLEHLTLNDASFRIGNGDWLHEIDKLTPYFAEFTGLRSFTMQDSSLQSLDFMKNWQQIEVIHLENNAISNVEPLVVLPNLKKLYILGNPVQNKSVLDQGILIY